MGPLVALVPVLRRPERVAPLVESFRAATPAGEIMLICSPGDLDEQRAIERARELPALAPFPPGMGDWSRKVNWGFRRAHTAGAEWMLLGGDDVRFHPGWFEAALAVHDSTGACVIGTNDLGNPTVKRGDHSTHPLVHRDYLDCGTIDEAGKVVSEKYWHNWVDAELVETAKTRGTWAFARDSIVEHLHWAWGKGADDEVYRLAREHYHADRKLFERRKAMWQGAS